MSAIFGIIKKSSGAIEPGDVVRLQQAIAHRDTDGRGLWQSDNVALGFSKLTIFPQQVGEQLPVETSDMVLTADIHLHNREELYQLLDLDKNQWHNESDSILLLKAYQLWGEHCVDKLEGEFAFAIWNKVSRRLFIATDQIGFRPVFYYDGPYEFIFCSELKGVEAAKTTPNYFNEEHLIEYYFRKSDPAQTFNKEIFALCGGNTLVIADDKITIRKYWTLEVKGKYHFTTDDEWIACTRDLLYRAIEKRLNSVVPTGVTLSGGLDSSSVACILADLLAKKNKSLYAFSSVLPVNHTGIERDERKFIEIINQRCPNIIQTYVEAPGLSPFDGAEEAFKLDEALPNSFFYIDSALLHAAGNKGVRSLFSGFGGDFFISSPGRYVIYMLIRQGDYKTARTLLKHVAHNNKTGLFKELKKEYLVNTSLWQQLRKLKPRKIDWRNKATFHASFLKKYNLLLDTKEDVDHRVSMKKIIDSGNIGRLTGRFANREAHFSIHSNTPLFDKDLMELLVEMPLHLFIKDGLRRNLIRQAMNDILPVEIRLRKDKLPYNPDFIQRTISNKNKLNAIVNSERHSFLFERYFSHEIINGHFDSIAPHAGFNGPGTAPAIRMAQTGISCKVLAMLKDMGYQFG